MSYNGSGTFVINSAGTPYVSGTVISSTAANALNSDLATGLSTAICKDGQTTVTANIPLGGFRITNLGAGTVASDAARLSQVQNSTTTTLISITGTDTITGTVSPTLTAYTAGQVFSFVVAATNTGAVTLNVDSIGVKSVTRTGAVALVAGDLVIGQIAIVEYDGTRFQLINGNSFSNLNVSGTLGVTGATTLSSTLAVTGITTVAAGTAALPSIISTTGTSDTGQWFPAADTVAWSTAGTERMRIGSTGIVGIGTTSDLGSGSKLNIVNTAYILSARSSAAAVGRYIDFYVDSASTLGIVQGGSTPGVGLTYGATSWSALSDETQKDIIEPITNGLEKISSLRSVIGKYKTDEISKRRSFLIAQDVEKVLPEAVDSLIDIKTEMSLLNLRYTDLIPLLVSAIKDLKTITEAQSSRITALETI